MKLSKCKNLFPVLAEEHDCTGCMACLSSCPVNAIQSRKGDDGHNYVEIDEDKCIGCKKCEKICQLSLSNYGDNDIRKSVVYAAWNTNSLDRLNSTSGGIFSAIAKTVLANQGAVVGATLEGRQCKHILISKVDDIYKLQGSKYMASSMEGIYNVIEEELCKGIVLFTGVGCQCAGVLAYFDKHKYRKNLITVDLVCGGAPSKILLDKYYLNNLDVEKIISFRNKDKYTLRIVKNGEIVNDNSKNLPLHGFNCDLTSRFSCYHCQFACAHRKTDLTIGDLWNYNIYKDEHEKGISTIIIHTEAGKNLVDNSNVELHQIKWKDCLCYCRRIVSGEGHIFRPRRNLARNAKNMPYENFVKLYCISMKPRDCILFVFRIYRFIVNRFLHFRIDYRINRILKKYEA